MYCRRSPSKTLRIILQPPFPCPLWHYRSCSIRSQTSWWYGLTSATVSKSHGRMVRKSITSHDTWSFSCAMLATSLKTWSCVPHPTRVTSLPGKIQSELHHCLEKTQQTIIHCLEKTNIPSSTAWKRLTDHHPLPGEDQQTIIHCHFLSSFRCLKSDRLIFHQYLLQFCSLVLKQVSFVPSQWQAVTSSPIKNKRTNPLLWQTYIYMTLRSNC